MLMPINSNAINPYIRAARPSVLLKGSGVKRRVIFDYELIYIERGEFTINYNEEDYKVLPGSLLLLRPGIPHCFKDLLDDVSQPHIHFDLFYSPRSTQTPVCYKDLCDLSSHEHQLMQEDSFHPYPQNPLITSSNREKFLSVFYSIVKNNEKESDLVQKAKMIQLLDMIISDNFPKSIFNKKQSFSIAQQIKAVYDSMQGLSTDLNELESMFSYSKYHMEHEFKKAYGVSIISYRNSKRMELAEKLLETHSVSAVSEALEFSSIYSFSRAFKRYFDVPPSKFAAHKEKIKKL